jgi:ferritin-like metal-binding protein YciE
MGQQQCVNLLQQNLSQEEAMAKRVETLSKQLGKQMIPQAR